MGDKVTHGHIQETSQIVRAVRDFPLGQREGINYTVKFTVLSPFKKMFNYLLTKLTDYKHYLIPMPTLEKKSFPCSKILL